MLFAIILYLSGAIVVAKLPHAISTRVGVAQPAGAENVYIAPTIAPAPVEPQLPVVAQQKAELPLNTAPPSQAPTATQPPKQRAGKKPNLPDDSNGKPIPVAASEAPAPAPSGVRAGGAEAASAEPSSAKPPSPLDGGGDDPAAVYDLGNVDAPPQPASGVEPEYPEIAQRRGITGVIVVATLVVDASGNVRSVQPHCYGCHAAFLESVRKALIKWKFKPAQRHGHPVTVRFEQEIHFDLMENR